MAVVERVPAAPFTGLRATMLAIHPKILLYCVDFDTITRRWP
ncbi:MAG: hypothetical protein M0Z33_03405 [Actinomycetota bacterium]|nr:hypothetical protein [Actinomycetota bacterium]